MAVKANKIRQSAMMDPAPVLVRESTVGPTGAFAAAELINIDMQGCDTVFIFVRALLSVASAVADVNFEPQGSGSLPSGAKVFQLLFPDSQAVVGGVQIDEMARKQYHVDLAVNPAENLKAFEVSVLTPSAQFLFWSDVAGDADDEVEVFVQRVVKYNVAGT